MNASAKVVDFDQYKQRKKIESFFELVLSDTETKYAKLRDILDISDLDERFLTLDALYVFMMKNRDYADEVFEDIIWTLRCEALMLQIARNKLSGGLK